MIRVNLCIEEEVKEQATEMKTKEKAREQFAARIACACQTDDMNNNNDELTKIMREMSSSIAKPPEQTWSDQVDKEAINYIKDHLLDNIISGLQSYDDITTLFDWHRNHSDAFSEMSQSSYGEQEALDLIHGLSSFEETEKDLIGNGDIADQLSNKAAWTYSNAMYHEIEMKLKEIKSNIDIEDIELEIANEIIKTHAWKTSGYEDNTEFVEMVKEQFEDEFASKLEAQLRALVLEEL